MKSTQITSFFCDSCQCGVANQELLTTGYVLDPQPDGSNKKICFACEGKRTAAQLAALQPGEKLNLYFSFQTGQAAPARLSNWPGTFTIPVWPRRGSHNMAGTRYDADFVYNGKRYHMTQIGDNNTLAAVLRKK